MKPEVAGSTQQKGIKIAVSKKYSTNSSSSAVLYVVVAAALLHHQSQVRSTKYVEFLASPRMSMFRKLFFLSITQSLFVVIYLHTKNLVPKLGNNVVECPAWHF